MSENALKLDIEQMQIKLDIAYQTIDEVLKANLELKAVLMNSQRNFQNTLTHQNNTIAELNKEIEALKAKLDFPILETPL